MAEERLYERKYYFGWYSWNGAIFCERWDADIGSSCGCTVKVEISKEEWDSPLTILETRYNHLIAGIV